MDDEHDTSHNEPDEPLPAYIKRKPPRKRDVLKAQDYFKNRHWYTSRKNDK